MKEAPALFVAFLFSLSQPARADTRFVSDAEAEGRCEQARAELRQIGIAVSSHTIDSNVHRARRRAFSDPEVQALVACQTKPARIEVFYPDGSRLGRSAFVVDLGDNGANGPVYVSERIRAERYVADVAAPVPFSPPVWWLGIGGDVLFSEGGVAPLAFVTLDGGYRFHRHGSVQAFVSVQPYMRRLEVEATETRLRVDQFGAAIAYHPLVKKRVDLAIAARVAAIRLGARGSDAGEADELESQRDRVWLAYPAGRLSLRVGIGDRLWLRLRGEVGAMIPRPVVAAGAQKLGSIGTFAAQAGLGLEVDFR